jgi:glycosyltransferase involved in cell wall biosynthesis
VTRSARPRHPPAGGGLLVLCAANNHDAVKVADQHMAEQLARRVPVLYVDPPLSRLTPRNDPPLGAALAGPRLRRTAAGFWRLTPVIAPLGLRAGVRRTSEVLVRRILARAVASLEIEVSAVVSAWPRLDVFGACAERVSVWWAQDDFAGGAALMGARADRLAAGEAARAEAADLVVAANPEIARRLRGAGHDVELIPYGTDAASFASVGAAERAAGVDLRPPVAALVGQLNARVDPRLLHAVVDAGMSLLLVGPAVPGVSWLEGLVARPRVQWVGPQPFDALASHLAHADVGLVPYADTAFNRGSFPLKTLEYLAAGLPVVSSDLPATRWLAASPELVAIAGAPAAFAEAALAASAQPLTPQARAARRRFVRAHTYEARARDLLAAIDARLRTIAPGPRTPDPIGTAAAC